MPTNNIVVNVFEISGPPSSPPALLRIINIRQQNAADTQNNVTEYAKLPGSIRNSVPLYALTNAANVHAIPMPRKTLTALLPVTLPIDESAYLSF